MTRRQFMLSVGLCLWLLTGEAARAREVLRTGSRAPYVHRISLYDAEGEVISPKDDPAPPYSHAATCGKCHDYASVGSGWHFNAPDAKVPPGRPGEPWIFTDLKTGTQMPISCRQWPGTYRPADAGLTPWQLILTFGSHMLGGGLGEKYSEQPEDPKARWKISGKLEIDCMSCHSAEPRHDPVEWGKQIEQHNFKWAAAATDGFAIVRGSTNKLPDTYDPLLDADPASSGQTGPKVIYDLYRFDADDRVLFNIKHKPAAERCYFCHSFRETGEGSPERWEGDGDVHLSAGLTCADCHRNGLDHAMTRGYKGEPAAEGKPSAAELTCRGCHESGRLGATRLRHWGMPASHLEKLTCTACHSGLKPAEQPCSIRTARAHGLGIASAHRRDDVPPFIVEPVLLRGADEKIAPHRMMWPAFWGRMKGEAVSPVAPEVIVRAAEGILGDKDVKPEDWQPLTEEQIAKILEAMSSQAQEAGEPVYICGGRLYRRTADGKLVGGDHPAASAYAWPVAHDVRPAGQSLGSGGCADCHTKKAGFFYEKVAAQSPAQIGAPVVKCMYEFQGYAPKELQAWARSVRYRNIWTVIGLAAAGILGLVFAQCVVAALGAALRAIFVRKPRRIP